MEHARFALCSFGLLGGRTLQWRRDSDGEAGKLKCFVVKLTIQVILDHLLSRFPMQSWVSHTCRRLIRLWESKSLQTGELCLGFCSRRISRGNSSLVNRQRSVALRFDEENAKESNHLFQNNISLCVFSEGQQYLHDFILLNTMMRPSFTVILSACFLAYIGHSMWTIYGLFYPEECPENGQCLRPYLRKKPNLEVRLRSSPCMFRHCLGQSRCAKFRLLSCVPAPDLHIHWACAKAKGSPWSSVEKWHFLRSRCHWKVGVSCFPQRQFFLEEQNVFSYKCCYTFNLFSQRLQRDPATENSEQRQSLRARVFTSPGRVSIHQSPSDVHVFPSHDLHRAESWGLQSTGRVVQWEGTTVLLNISLPKQKAKVRMIFLGCVTVLCSSQEAQTVGSVRQPVTHWRSKLVFNVVTQEIAFPRHSVPLEILRHIKWVDENWNSEKDHDSSHLRLRMSAGCISFFSADLYLERPSICQYCTLMSWVTEPGIFL